MKKYLIFFIFAVVSLNAYCQAVSQERPLTIGEIRTINSKILKEKRTLNIYIPEKYDSSKAYPVIYLLDGSINEDFLHICGLVQYFNLTFKMPEFIVVGIANVDRRRDFTFKTDIKELKRDYPTTGHSEEFINFIKDELQPFINQNYKTSNTRYLIGQSLGGLLASEILIKQPDLFTHYFIVSPSLWWDNGSLLKGAPILISNNNYDGIFVNLSVGKNEEPLMIEQAKQFFYIFSSEKNLNIEINKMENEDHATILHNAIYAAFLKLFPYKP